MSDKCVFCELPDNRIVLKSDFWFVIRDGYPVSPGHSLIIPNRHVSDYFDITEEEHKELQQLINKIKCDLDKEYQPDGYNIGINCGAAAGQTVFHLHVHLIPRFSGDMDDPRGGVRGVIPEKQKY